MTTGYTTVTAASYGGPLPVTSLEVPDDGTDIIAGDVRNYETAFLAEVKDIRTNATTGLANKLNRTGDTSTGLQTFAAGATVSSGQSLGMNGANITGTVGFSALGEVLLYGRKAWFRAAMVNSSGASAKPMFVYDSFARSRVTAASMKK